VPYNGPNGKPFEHLVEIDYTSTYDQTRKLLYKEIGCADVPEQNLPTIGCHFSKNVKSKITDLANWEFVKQEYILEVQKKGVNGLINIILPNNVSISNFYQFISLLVY